MGTVREELEKAAHDGDFLAMLALGDWLKENGEEDLGHAYKWAAKRGHFPDREENAAPRWAWCWRRTWPTNQTGERNQLPRLAMDGLETWNFTSPAAAFEELARALRKIRDVWEA